MKLVFGLLAVTKSRYTNAKATISGLYHFFSSLPVPDYTQIDGGLLLTSMMEQRWDRKEGIQRNFSYYYEIINLIIPKQTRWWNMLMIC